MKNEVFEVYEKYKKVLWKDIPRLTGVKWKIKKVGFRKWKKPYWSTKGKTILIGGRKPMKKFLCSTVHEMIHIDTLNNKIRKEINLSKKSLYAFEIVTIILTNNIVRKINKKYNKRFAIQHFDIPYKKYEQRYREFSKLEKNKNFKEFYEAVRKRLK